MPLNVFLKNSDTRLELRPLHTLCKGLSHGDQGRRHQELDVPGVELLTAMKHLNALDLDG